MRSSIDAKAGSVSFSVDTGIYPKEVVYKACYSFIDRMYIFLDTAKRKGIITVTIKGKTLLRKKALETLEGEFMNELLNSLVREKVSKRNRKVLEEIVGGAMGAALGVREMEGGDRKRDGGGSDTNGIDDAEAKEIEAAVEALKSELAAIESGGDYESDLLGIRTIVTDESACDSSGADGSCGSCGGCSTGSDDVSDDAEAKEIEAAVEALKSELAAIESVDAVPTKRKPATKKPTKKPAKKVAIRKTAVGSTIKKHGNGTRNKR